MYPHQPPHHLIYPQPQHPQQQQQPQPPPPHGYDGMQPQPPYANVVYHNYPPHYTPAGSAQQGVPHQPQPASYQQYHPHQHQQHMHHNPALMHHQTGMAAKSELRTSHSQNTSSDSDDVVGGHTSSKRKRTKHDDSVDPQLKALRTRKHNEAEVRRRTRLNELLFDLGQLVRCKKQHKSAILRTAIERIGELEGKVSALGGQVWADSSRSTSAGGISIQKLPSMTQPSSSTGISPASSQDSDTATPDLQQHHSLLYKRHSVSSPLQLPTDQVDDVVASLSMNTSVQQAMLGEASKHMPTGVDMLHTSSLAVAITEMATGRIMDCNQGFASFLGYSRAVLLGSDASFLGITHDSSIRTTFQLVQALVTSLASGRNNAMRAIKRYTTADGVQRDAAITVWLLANKDSQYKFAACLLEPLEGAPSTSQQLQQTSVSSTSIAQAEAASSSSQPSA